MLRALLLGALAAAPGALATAQTPPPPLTFDALVARAAPDPGQLRLEAELAARQRQLAATGGIFREGALVAAETGPRRGPLASGTDRAVQVEAPLLLAPGLRSQARDRLDQAQGTQVALGRAESRHRLRLAYLDAWLAAALLQLRQDQLALTEVWERAARARVEAGFDPAYQVDLVRGERLRGGAELAEAQRRLRETWGSLRALADLPPDPLPLADPGEATLPPPAGLAAAFEGGLARRAVQERLAAERAAFEVQQAARAARWSLKGSHAREGDETITRVGLAYRLPQPGELSAQRRETTAGRSALAREAEVAALQLEARFQGCLARLGSLGESLSLDAFTAALRAVDLRLREGKERPSEALLTRRQLLDAELAALQRRHDAHALAADLDLLTLGAAR